MLAAKNMEYHLLVKSIPVETLPSKVFRGSIGWTWKVLTYKVVLK